MQAIIIVDDKTASRTTVAYSLKLTIEEMTGGDCTAELLEGEIITEALTSVREAVDKIQAEGIDIAGFLFDLVDETRKIADAGAILLDKVKDDPQLRDIPVVLYTVRHTEVSVADLRKRGARALVRRRLTGGHGVDKLAEEILDAFGILY